jgi:DNA-binding GntR family transcriptional regulator
VEANGNVHDFAWPAAPFDCAPGSRGEYGPARHAASARPGPALMRPLGRLTRRATAQQVFQDLRQSIIHVELRPGDPLSETRVGESYGLSRTPVREVFRRLGEAGLLRIIPNVGTFVAPINILAVRDGAFLRETVECRAAADAARRAGKAETDQLLRLVEEQAAAIAHGDLVGFFARDEDMHRLLTEIADHPLVWSMIAPAKAQLDRVRHLSLVEAGWTDMIMEQHQDLVAAVATHDAAGAAEVMAAHLRTPFAAIDRIASRHPDFFEGGPPGRGQAEHRRPIEILRPCKEERA